MRNLIAKLRALYKKIPVHPLFFLLLLWFLCCDSVANFLAFALAVLTHELGHYFIAKKLGYKLDNFFIAPYGVSLNYDSALFDRADEVKIALAGPLTNFGLSVVAISLWWIFPESYALSYNFVASSVMLGLYNLLPAYPLDGGRVMIAWLGRFMPRQRALNFAKVGNAIFSAMLFVAFVVSCFFNFNPTLGLSAIFMVLGSFKSKKEGEYKLLALYKKKNKPFSKPFVLYADRSASLKQLLKHVQENRYTLFYVDLSSGTKIIDEKLVMKLCLAYPVSTTLDQIFSQDRL